MTKPNPTPPCKACGRIFRKPHKRAIYCCVACAIIGRISPMRAGECWPWNGAKNDKGYGQISFAGERHYVHRLHFEIHRGDIPTGQVIRHTCDNPACCNPDHMELGTQADNMMDMVKRQRGGTQKLTPDQVRAIRSLRGTMTQKRIANCFGVSLPTIESVLSRRTYSYVD